MRQPARSGGGGGSNSAAALFGARLIAALPLFVAQALGAMLARVAVRFARRERERLHANLGIAGYGGDASLARAAVGEAGKTLFELPWVWLRPVDEVLSRVRSVEGIEHVTAANARGKGIVFLTPHLGCFEVAAQFAGSHGPITVMFRPPRQPALRPLLEAGRRRGNVSMVPANTRGATALLAALRRGEWIGILPDQVPTGGEGEWAPFFGRPAFTMTLATRLVERTGAAALMGVCERLPRGRGWTIRIEPLPARAPDESATTAMNRALEAAIRRRPEQYLWSYHRYRTPAGVEPPPGTPEG
jgi:Kdo2-lipid IVA lauroyltransferase/acyltransferase